jgi:formate dehydrogenase major subunit
MNPEEREAIGVRKGELVKVLFQPGYCITCCLRTDRVKGGALYMTCQWWIAACNELTQAPLDPASNTLEYKYTAWGLEKIANPPWAEKQLLGEYAEIHG